MRTELLKILDAIASGDPLKLRESINQFSSERLDDGFVIVAPLLSSDDASHRLAGIEALAGNTTDSALSWLIEHAESDPSAEVRLECLNQLDDLPSEDSRDVFLKKTTDPERRVRQFAASGLRHYADDEVARALARFVVDDDVYVQERAIESLAASDRYGSSYLMFLLFPLWEGTYWESVIRPHANAQGDRRLVQDLTASFRRDLLAQGSSATMALRWMSLVDPEAVLSFAEGSLGDAATESLQRIVRALSELLRIYAQLSKSREHVQGRCIALLRVIAERDERSEAAEEARLLLEYWHDAKS